MSAYPVPPLLYMGVTWVRAIFSSLCHLNATISDRYPETWENPIQSSPIISDLIYDHDAYDKKLFSYLLLKPDVTCAKKDSKRFCFAY